MERALLGFSEVDITPPGPVQTIGFGRADETSRGVLHGLSAQVSVWSCGTERGCLAAVDHIGFSTEHADFLRDQIGKKISVPREQVMLCFSHTHSAPNDSVEEGYFRFAASRILEAAEKAFKSQSPVKAAWGNAYGDIGVNRRPDSRELDRRIGVLKAADAETGRLRLLVLRVTAHANVLKEDNYLISPDYFGAVRDRLSARYGCPVMLTQGASGNVSPWYYKSGAPWTTANPAPPFYGVRQSASALEDMAVEVLRAVDGVISAIQPREVTFLKTKSVRQEVCADVPSPERAREIAGKAMRYAHIDGSAWLAEIERLNREGVACQKSGVELQYFALNDGCLCGLSNEIMCELALRASERLGDPLFYLGGYTNGCTGYLPTEEEYDKGGFEVHWSMLIYWPYYHRAAALNRDTARRIVDCAVRGVPKP